MRSISNRIKRKKYKMRECYCRISRGGSDQWLSAWCAKLMRYEDELYDLMQSRANQQRRIADGERGA